MCLAQKYLNIIDERSDQGGKAVVFGCTEPGLTKVKFRFYGWLLQKSMRGQLSLGSLGVEALT